MSYMVGHTLCCLKISRCFSRIEGGCSLSVWSGTDFKQNPHPRWEPRWKDFNPRLMGKEPTYPLLPAFSQEAKKWDTLERCGEIFYTRKLTLYFKVSVKMLWVTELKNKHLFVSFGLGKLMLLWKIPKANFPENFAVRNTYSGSWHTYIIANK